MRIGAPLGRAGRALADLHVLDGLDAHEGLGQQPVETAVPVHVTTEADRGPVDEDLDHSSEGVARPWPPP